MAGREKRRCHDWGAVERALTAMPMGRRGAPTAERALSFQDPEPRISSLSQCSGDDHRRHFCSSSESRRTSCPACPGVGDAVVPRCPMRKRFLTLSARACFGSSGLVPPPSIDSLSLDPSLLIGRRTFSDPPPKRGS